ncbi:hypothetical protein [Engelhardtia mirabilis]|uniref:Flagellar FliJ protein n=1 Tax=Engelhardtia mirabilis TaxID=2528011 RepID=A0A518BST2_9BACT|nr:Flagellar FliJ protein [Planctomycetes bacterium Pla133]QDV04355.1 Flagellar FliJ protein [Planctomycetes bacterium Pla86]
MKRRFQFRLERLAQVRELEERIARAKWGEAEAIAAQAAAHVVTLETTLQRAREELRNLQSLGELDAAAALSCERPIETLKAHLAAARALHAEQRAAAERERGAWAERERARRALERLEDKAKAIHTKAIAAADQAEADDANAARATRRAATPEGLR